MIPASLNFFLHLQALVALVAVSALALRWLVRLGLPLGAKTELRLHYFLISLLALLLFLPFARQAAPDQRPFVRVMEASRPEGSLATAAPPAPRLMVGQPTKASTGVALGACAFLVALLLLWGMAAVAIDYFRLRRALRGAVVYRRVGRVRLAVTEQAISPYSTLTILPGLTAWVVLPVSLLVRPEHARIAVAHELQHHRAGDTLFCHLFGAPLRALCFFHPLRRAWASALAEAQELACDEFLVNQKKIGVRNYSGCLIAAAETAVKGRAGRAYAAAPSLFSDRHLLKRRIEAMYGMKQNNKKWLGYALGLSLGCCLAASAASTGAWVIDSRIRMEDAQKMVEAAKQSSDFPVAVNEKVLKYLNWYLGSVKGREALKASLARLEALKPRFEAKLALHNAPPELLAIGLIESGYQNLPSEANKVSGAAGIWQFIASTARVFGLRVDEKVDERLDIDLETDAAFRYLVANKMRFNDWLLGVMAYNMGERHLDRAIAQSGTRDPWELVRRGFENDSDYLPKFMAAVLILKNPQVLR